jgi:glycine hydroxymethyltransferase
VQDPELAALVRRETDHYLSIVDLIAASNAPTWAVRANAGWGVAQFRSAEGLAGRRPYAGTSEIDAAERLAITRACRLFQAEHANVQPLSGSLANLAALNAVLEPGETLLSLAMHAGGHLSHGHPKHLVSELYHVASYTVDPRTCLLDYDQVREVAHRVRPKAIVAGFSSYPRQVDFARFAEIAAGVGAHLIADISHIAGLVAAGLHPNPCESDAIVTTSVEKTLRGSRGGIVLCPARLGRAVDAAVFPGLQSSVGMGGLVSLCQMLAEAEERSFRQYQERVVAHARLLGEALVERAVPLVTGGTDTHLLLLDVGAIGLTGRAAEARLESVGILSNRNLLPFDSRGPFEASGLRLGTPTITARGYDATDVRELGDVVATCLLAEHWEQTLHAKLLARVCDLVHRSRPGDTLLDLATESTLKDGLPV